jgi:hypothetical protein
MKVIVLKDQPSAGKVTWRTDHLGTGPTIFFNDLVAEVDVLDGVLGFALNDDVSRGNSLLFSQGRHDLALGELVFGRATAEDHVAGATRFELFDGLGDALALFGRRLTIEQRRAAEYKDDVEVRELRIVARDSLKRGE